MKLDPTALRYLSRDEFRVLTAVEMGMKNHDLVPRELVTNIAALRHGGAEKMLQTLLRHKLLHHEGKGFDGYRLTTLGYDYLALRAFLAKGLISGVGTKIGVGKESDIFLVENEQERVMVLKLHRLGRTSFRKIKSKRDYHGKRGHPSWIYLSRLASQKEFAYMKALHEAGFPVPEPIEANRHCVLMSLLTGWPLHTVLEMVEPERCMQAMLDIIIRLAKCGLIHGDFNEFNVAVSKEDSSQIVMYDFPQMVSMNHPNAKMYFDRDVDGVFRFFRLRFDVDTTAFDRPEYETLLAARERSLDVEVGASGFSKQENQDFETEMEKERMKPHEEINDEDDDEDDEEDNEEDNEDGGQKEGSGEAVKALESGMRKVALRDDAKEGVDEDDPKLAGGPGDADEEGDGSSTDEQAKADDQRRRERVQKEVARRIRKQMQSGKTSRNTVKSRERRKVKESMLEW